MKRFLLLLLLYLSGCITDTIYVSFIANVSGKNVFISVVYDKGLLSQQCAIQALDKKECLQNQVYETSRAYLSNIDTAEASVTYLLPHNSKLMLGNETSFPPRLELIKHIVIMKDTFTKKVFDKAAVIQRLQKKSSSEYEWKLEGI
ncbi:MAG TPA: hypothetical protein VF408_06215 [Sediminibacterium sp.]